jgi:hypothetical protein
MFRKEQGDWTRICTQQLLAYVFIVPIDILINISVLVMLNMSCKYIYYPMFIKYLIVTVSFEIKDRWRITLIWTLHKLGVGLSTALNWLRTVSNDGTL